MRESQAVVAIVDDDAMCRRMVEFIVKKGGMRVRSFDSAEAFLGEPAHDDYGCIVLDMCMPGLSGFELQCKLNETGQVAPILFLTAEADPVHAAAVIRNGATDMIQKPIEPDVLLEKIREAIACNAKAA